MHYLCLLYFWFCFFNFYSSGGYRLQKRMLSFFYFHVFGPSFTMDQSELYIVKQAKKCMTIYTAFESLEVNDFTLQR